MMGFETGKNVWTGFKNNTKRKSLNIRMQDKLTNVEKRLLKLIEATTTMVKQVGPQAECTETNKLKGLDFEKIIDETLKASNKTEPECYNPFLPSTEVPVTSAKDWCIETSAEDTAAPAPNRSQARSSTHHQKPSRDSTPQPQKRPTLTPLEEYLLKTAKRRREDDNENSRFREEIEREKIRQRDVELRQRDEELKHRDVELRQRDTELLLQAQWVQVAKASLSVLDRYLNGKT